MEQETSEHKISTVPDGDGILVTCTCGWRVWSRTSPTPVTLELAEAQIGAKHLANVYAPTPPRRDVLLAVGFLGCMVLVTVVAVYLISTW